ncbi:MAG: hypothetical protein JEY96_10395 [Bacteroidales bacterium]|jgi:hypothetical protein|nr:hypothetical protein [Bacteroidales bacterium]
MKPEKFIGIMLITLLLSCEMDEQVEQKIGEVSFESNQSILNSSFDVDIYIDGAKIGSLNEKEEELKQSISIKERLQKKLNIGVHDFEAKIYSYDGEPGKSIKGKFIVNENKTSEVFIDFKEYNSWN